MYGYLHRWLDFKYPTTYSHLREELILNELHRKIVTDIYALKTLKEASVAGGLVTLDTKHHTYADKSYEGYMRSLLPSLVAPTTIPITKQDKEHWAAVLKKKNEELQASLKKK